MKTPKLRTCGFLICAFNNGAGRCTCADIALDKYGQCVTQIIKGLEMAPYKEASRTEVKEEEGGEARTPIGFAAD